MSHHHHHPEQHEPRELAAFLKANTRATHQSVDDLVMSVQPFSTPENYTRFLQLQAVFHKIVDDVYKNATLNQHIDGLAALARYDDVITDLRDLNAQEAHIRAAIPAPQGAEAIGWLYCAEGSNLGAAFLFKDAQNNLGYNESHGARHLAPHMDGRGKHWRAFVGKFNQLPLSAEEQETALKGALEAFAFYKVLLREIFEVA